MRLNDLPPVVQQDILTLLKRDDFIAAKALYDRYETLNSQPDRPSGQSTRAAPEQD